MHYALITPPAEKHVNTEAHLSATNIKLSRSHNGHRQIAFDWDISEDRLHFTSKLDVCVKEARFDTTKIWRAQDFLAIIHHDERERFRTQLLVATEAGIGNDSFCNVELRLIDTANASHWIDINGKIVERDDTGRAARMIGIISEIDKRTHDESPSFRLRNLYVALSQTNQAIVRNKNRDALFKEVCRIAVVHGQFDSARIDLIDSRSQHLTQVAAHGIDMGASNSDFTSLGDTEQFYRRAIAWAIRKNQPIICNSGRAACARRTCGNMEQDGSVAFVPFRRDGCPFGTLTLYSPVQNFFDAATIDVLQQLAHDISSAIDNFERESRRRNIKLNQADNEKFNSAILTAALDCIVSINQHGEIIGFNHASEKTFGYSSDEILGKKLVETLIPPEWREQHQLGMAHFLATGKCTMLNRRIELSAMRADGSIFPIELAIVPLRIQNGSVFTAFIRDISDRKQEEMLQLGQNRILNMVATGVPLSTILTEITRLAENQCNHAICTIRQGCESEIEFLKPIDSTAPGKKPTHETCISWPILGNENKALGTFTLHFRDAISLSDKAYELSKICAGLAGIAIESRASEERIRYLAHYDGLTSLPNRFLFKEYLDLALQNAQRHRKKFAVLFLDLDKFKEINDTLGHDAGDKVLREVATRLRDTLRHTDKIARMGGDEFYVLIEDLDDGRYAADVARKLLDEAARPVRIDDGDCELSVSIGIAIFPDDGINGHELLKNADSAMYRAKELGKDGFRFYASLHEDQRDKKNGKQSAIHARQ
jgi:diguanylate cyclase (GGDEF)-like protein/PAS domain S-box-containing protein